MFLRSSFSKCLVNATDVIVEIGDNVLLIERVNFPFGWALPGGFVEYGESFEMCAVREVWEETGLKLILKEQFYTYSNPKRDPRQQTATTVFIGVSYGVPKASGDAKKVGFFDSGNLPDHIAFDHADILSDYFQYVSGKGKEEIFKKYM